jgi:hypothetical protein
MSSHFQYSRICISKPFLVLLTIACLSHAQSDWVLRNSLPSNIDLSSVIHCQGQYLAVGYEGVVFASTDGNTWDSHASGTSNDLYSVAHGLSLYVAVGDKGTILTSPDGITWNNQTSGTARDLRSVAWGDSGYVAVGRGGTILSSPDGRTWSDRTIDTSYEILSAAYGGNRFIAVGYDNDGLMDTDRVILVSANGISWMRKSVQGRDYLTYVVYDAGQYVVADMRGDVLTSDDCETWASHISGTQNHIESITYGNGHYVAVGWEGTVCTSADGITWLRHPVDSTLVFYSVVYGDSQFVAVGWGGRVLTSAADHNASTKQPSRSPAPELAPQVTLSGHALRVILPRRLQSSELTIAVFDAKGQRLCCSRACANGNSLDIQGIVLGPGQYEVVLRNGSARAASSLLVEH